MLSTPLLKDLDGGRADLVNLWLSRHIYKDSLAGPVEACPEIVFQSSTLRAAQRGHE